MSWKSATSEYLPYRLHRFHEVQRCYINKRLLFLQKHTWKILSKKVRRTYTGKGHGFTYHDYTTCAPWNISKTIWYWSILTSAPVNIFSEPSLKVKSHDYTWKNKPISYTTIRQNLLKVIKAVGLNWKDYGLHSLWAGGVYLAANKGIPDRLFKRHGRWKSCRAKDGYVEDDLKMLLSVSKNRQN